MIVILLHCYIIILLYSLSNLNKMNFLLYVTESRIQKRDRLEVITSNDCDWSISNRRLNGTTSYLGARLKNVVSHRADEERRISPGG